LFFVAVVAFAGGLVAMLMQSKVADVSGLYVGF
jgi:hypothetical protein